MLKSGVGGQNGVVRLDDGVGHRRGRVNAKLELRLLAVVVGETLHEEGTETRTGSTTEGVEDEEALQARAVVSQTTDLVHDGVDELLADGVVTASICRATRPINDRKQRERTNINSQLFAASSFPEIIVSGWNSER